MEKYDKVLFDFDDTIWSRDSKDIDCSVYNSTFIKNHLDDKAIIISGNSYKSIKDKLDSIGIKFPMIWADANSILYEYGVPTVFINKCDISKQAIVLTKYIKDKKLFNNIEPQFVGVNGVITNIKYKPVLNRRDHFVYLINLYIKELDLDNCVAKPTGKTTIDIVSIYNSKVLAYEYLRLDDKKTLYVGDEIDEGNDLDVANLCTRKFKVNNVYDTKHILDCFGGVL